MEFSFSLIELVWVVFGCLALGCLVGIVVMALAVSSAKRDECMACRGVEK